MNKTEQPQWYELSDDQKHAILCLALSRSTNEASQFWRSTKRGGRTKFYEVYATVKPFWKQMTAELPNQALQILHGGTIAAARELVDEIKDGDVKIRNKAANDVLDRVLSQKKEELTPPQVNVQNIINNWGKE